LYAGVLVGGYQRSGPFEKNTLTKKREEARKILPPRRKASCSKSAKGKGEPSKKFQKKNS